MRPILNLSILLLIVATHAIPRGHYSSEHIWNIRGLRQCRMIGELCLNHYDCCGIRTVCRVLPGDDGPFSMAFRCDEEDKKRFYYG